MLRRAARLARRPAFRAAAFALLALVIVWPILATAHLMNVFRDAQVLFAYERDAAGSLLRFGAAPLWDPYYCGGLYALGTPQSRFVSPTFLLSLLCGPARGEALTLFALILLGLEGTFRYARARGADALGALLAAPVFAASGVFIASTFLGWTNFFGFELVPWALLFVRRAVRGDTRAAVWAALFLAWIVGFGGTYAAPFTALLCLYELGECLLAREQGWRARRRALGLGAFVAALALAVAGLRLAPLLETLLAAPRVISGRPGMSLAETFELLWRPVRVAKGELFRSERMYTVGAGALVVGLVGLGRRRLWPVLPLAVVAFTAALGYGAGSWGPFAILKRLPLFSALRYPERYLIVVALVVAVAAANGVAVLGVVARRRRWGSLALAGAVVLLLGNTAFLVSDFHVVAAARLLELPPPELARPFQQARGNRWRAAFYAPMSRGSLSCWEAYPVPMSPLLRGDLSAEEYLDDPEAGAVTRRAWSPNAIDLDVALVRAATLLVNQNFHPGWRSDVGHVRDHDGLLAVDLPAGARRVSLRFRPRSALAGVVSSTAALLAIAGLLAFSRRRARALAAGLPAPPEAPALLATAVLPLVLGAVVYLAVSETRPVRPPLRAPSGEEVLIAQPSEGVTAVGATFGPGIVLDGARIIDPAGALSGDPASLELDWRIAGTVPDDLEILVAIEPTSGGVLDADHELVSAALRLSDAPRGVPLRDIVPFILSSDPAAGGFQAAGGFDVWVGLRVVGSQRLLPIAPPVGVAIRADRVLAASLRPPP